MENLTRQVAGLSADKRRLFELLMKQQSLDPARYAGIPRRGGSDVETPPLAYAQQRLWFLDQLDPGSAFYNIPAAVRLRGPLDAEGLARALEEVVRRHEALRTTFRGEDGRPLQVVAPALPLEQETELPVHDLRHLPETEREEAARRLASEEARRPFDLERGPLLRAALLRLDAEDHVLLINLHHIVADGWSARLLIQEIAALYAGTALDEPPIQYGDYAVWQRGWLQGETLRDQLAYWTGKLSGRLPSLELPADHPRPPVPSHRGADVLRRFPATLLRALTDLGQSEQATLFMVLLAGLSALLSRYTGEEDILIGTPIANRTRPELEGLIGLFANTLVLRTDASGEPTFRELVRRARETALGAYAHQDTPFEQLVDALHVDRDLSRSPLFQVFFTLAEAPAEMPAVAGLALEPFAFDSGTAAFDLTLSASEVEGELEVGARYSTDLFEEETIVRLLDHLRALLEAAAAAPDQRVADLPLLTAEEHRLLAAQNDTRADYPRDADLPGLFAEQVERTPDLPALSCEGETLTYRELSHRVRALARTLAGLGVSYETIVGVSVERSPDLVVSLLAVLECGGAYLPLDPTYPAERIALMLEDSGAPVVIAGERQAPFLPPGVTVVRPDSAYARLPDQAFHRPPGTSDRAAYLIYTSGSTGRPKGVAVSHRNVVNFFTGMDARLGGLEPGASGFKNWLAVTSVSFDISVLEILWTLTRGFHVILQGDERPVRAAGERTDPLDFSLFYFASNASAPPEERYRLLLEGAKFADQAGFAAVWTPERHFHDFGGPYPNPAVTGAALAALTKNIEIRAGSVVAPLHDPIRIAEEWAVVDNLSLGRAGISFASGWHADDFVFAPDLYASRKEALLRKVETVRQLWRGEAVKVRGGLGQEVEVRILPRPIRPELPVWLTAAGNPETFRMAGEIGAGVLTHLLGQDLGDLAGKIAAYREAWRAAGHSGTGQVVLMIHTFVGEDAAAVRATVREPFRAYLRSSVELVGNLAQRSGRDAATLSAEDLEALLDHAFDRYFEESGLFGTPVSCLATLDRIKAAGVDEVACLIDFGVATDEVLASLRPLDRLRRMEEARCAAERSGHPDRWSLERHARAYEVTHLQCTPSMARLLLASPGSRQALAGLDNLMLGGEALPAALVGELRQVTGAEIHNMYGPTETTIWSATERVGEGEGIVPLGQPIANTEIHLLDHAFRPVPVGVPGELWIGGDGVARGYFRRPELTADRFRPDAFSGQRSGRSGERLYRTGDLARRRPDGTLDFLGRVDHQVKVRGFRIELGEIESVLLRQPAVAAAAVVGREEKAGDYRLIAYLQPRPGETIRLDEARRGLRQSLPDYMVPGSMVVLETLPLTPNGKIDRRALPAPESAGVASGAQYEAPRNPVEEALVASWMEILQVDRIGIRDNFFEIGGHSLLSTQVLSRVRDQFHVELPLRDFFEAPTVAGLADAILRRQAEKALAEGEDLATLLAGLAGMSDEEAQAFLEMSHE